MIDFIATADVEQVTKSCKKENIHMLFSWTGCDVNYVIIFKPFKIL